MPARIALPQPSAARLPRLPRTSWRGALGAVAVAVVLVVGWMWLRDSSLVKVSQVRVTGVPGFGGAAVRSALDGAARDMTTLHVDEGALRAAVARYPLVRDVEVSAHPPHRLDVRVIERVPLGVIRAGAAPTVVADDGVLLRGVPSSGLPEISTRVPPGGARIGDRKTAVKVAVLAEAPRALRARIVRVGLGAYGLQARLRSGPVLRFGDGSRLRAKWIAAARVLADPSGAAAKYIDLRIPSRPAAGGLTDAQGGAPEPVAAAPVDSTAAADPAATTPVDPAVAVPAATATP